MKQSVEKCAVRSWAAEDSGVLWMLADEDFTSVPGVLKVDFSRDLDEWEELLGKPPQDLNLDGILYLAYCAAAAQVGAVESASGEPALLRESREQFDRIEGMLRAIQNSQAEVLLVGNPPSAPPDHATQKEESGR